MARTSASAPSWPLNSPDRTWADEVGDRLGVAAVRRHGGMQLAGTPSFSVQMLSLRYGSHGLAAPLDVGAAVGAVHRDVALVVRDPLRPAGFDQQRAAVVQPQERRGQVLDVELRLRDPGLAGRRVRRRALARAARTRRTWPRWPP